MLSLPQMLDLWVDITGVNPSEKKTKYKMYLDGRLSDYDIEKMNDRIKESLTFDETGLFAQAYLSVYLKKFLDNKTVSLFELLNNPELSDYVNVIKTLNDALKESDAEAVIMQEAKKAMEFYKLPCSLDALAVMEVRSSAIKCMNEKLRLIQFSGGNQKADSFKLSKDIYMFDSLDDLVVCCAKGGLDGVTLGYIRDKENASYSFFAFIIKNGDNLYLLTDMPKFAHPNQRNMSRCPGRNMYNRIEANYFPYDTVANIDTSDLWNTGRYGVSEKAGDLSVNVHPELPYCVIGTIESLSEEEAFWFVVMADLIKKKFYREELPQLEISYTKSMIRTPLLEETQNALVVQKNLPSMSLDEVDISDTYNLDYERNYKEDSDELSYLIERYDQKIDKSVLNVFCNTKKAALIEDKYATKDHWGKKTGCEFMAMDVQNTAGTKEDIEYRQKWIARYNYAKALNLAIKDDYKEKYEMLYGEIKEHVKNRIRDLVCMHLRGELVGAETKREGFGTYYTEDTVKISKVTDFDRWYEEYSSFRFGFGTARIKGDCSCAFTGKKPGVAITINPRNAKELALLCGIRVDELPVCLQHFDKAQDKYHGNCILDNIDPFLWVIKDEFNTMDFEVTILLSKKAYLDFCKEAGVEAVKFWEIEKPVCYNTGEGGCKGAFYKKYERYSYCYKLSKKCEKCKWYKDNQQKLC